MSGSAIGGHSGEVVGRVLREEGQARHHVVVALSGAHAYGFPSPDSDFDLKAIHLAPTASLVGLSTVAPSATRVEIIEGVEIDYSSNELGPVLAGVLTGNGNYIERVLGPILLVRGAEHAELAELVRGSLSRRVHRHYHGFARGQLRELEQASAPTAKRLLYVLRTALTGTHLLRTGELITDLNQLWRPYGFPAAAEMIELKTRGERVLLDADERDRQVAALAAAFELLDGAVESSPLPEEPPNALEVDRWLIEMRRRHF